MVCRKFYLRVVSRILLLLLNCLALFYIIFHLPNVSLIILAALILVYQVASLIRYLNRVNTRLETFFQAHLSGEVVSSFSKLGKQDEFSRLYGYFNRLNEKLEAIRIRTEISNAYFRTIVDQTAVGLIAFTNEGKVEFINDAAKRMLKVFVVRDLSKLDTLKEGFGMYLMNLEPEKTELVPVVADDEMIQLSVKKTDFRSGEVSLHLATLQNIKPELDQKEIESWQRLIRVLRHEIMNSITPITSFVDSVTRIFREKDSGKIVSPKEVTAQMIDRTIKGLDIVEGRCDGLIQFVNNYRDLTKLPMPVIQAVYLKPLLQNLALLHQGILEEMNIRVSIQCHQSLRVQADPRLLEQVMINLFKNAIEAIDRKPNGMIKLSAHEVNGRIVIEVEDNGKGIPPEVDMNMWVPFFTTKEKGSGIGLSLSRQIIRQHGGNLDYYSVPGERTVFTVKI